MTAKIVEFIPASSEATDAQEVDSIAKLANQFFACMSEQEKAEYLAAAKQSQDQEPAN